jgi:hypothetical protein
MWSAAPTLLSAAATLFLATAAPAEPNSPCHGRPPAEGVVFRGPVLHVPDGRTVCVARGFDPGQWIPLEIADAPRMTARATLMAVAFGKDVDCAMAADGRGHCVLGGRSLGSLAADPAAAEAGRAWREAGPDATASR